MKIRLFIGFLWLLGLLQFVAFNGCKKSKSAGSLNSEELITPTQQAIHKSVWLDANTGFICGGKKNETGFIYRTKDAGKTWELIFNSPNKCLYDINFVNDTIAYCCGDALLVLRSSDNGNTWIPISFANINLEDFNYTPLRCIFGNYNLLMIVGGENYHNGNALWFENNTMRWVWHFDHEFRTGLNFLQENFVLAGYGNSYRTTDHGYTYTPMEFSGDFFTSSSTINSQIGFVSGYDGGIYRTDDAGHNWKTLLKPNKTARKRIHFNGIYFSDATNGWAVGTDGLVMSSDDGQTFTEYTSITKADLLSVVKDKLGRIVISSSAGKLHRITD
ncbi:MAG: hypothetical protein SGJ15_08705 [Bacteroidota bacterium]|nr:hypothetical protein [Bacteroidota bacterium]